MLLAIDVGNTNAVLGLYRPIPPEAGTAATPHRFHPEPVAHWRITTPDEQTADEFGVLLRSLFESSQLALSVVTGICIASVVPPAEGTLRHVCEAYFNLRPLFIEPGVKTGLPILTDHPAEVGADRIVDCVAAFERFHAACITVDMGTATVFNAISARGEFLGGAIAPGLGISADALFSRAARLPRVDVRKPAKVIGTGTVDNIQIGLYYGYIGLVDGILERMLERMTADLEAPGPTSKGEIPIIATGGLAPLIASGSRYLHLVDPHLTLTGVRLVYERHQQRARRVTS
jgi:type III pantothenate kinase